MSHLMMMPLFSLPHNTRLSRLPRPNMPLIKRRINPSSTSLLESLCRTFWKAKLSGWKQILLCRIKVTLLAFDHVIRWYCNIYPIVNALSRWYWLLMKWNFFETLANQIADTRDELIRGLLAISSTHSSCRLFDWLKSVEVLLRVLQEFFITLATKTF